MAIQSVFQQKFSRSMGSFKPRFEGKPADYWQLNNFDAGSAILMLCTVIWVSVALSIGCMYWIVLQSSQQFALVWSIFTIVFIILFLFLSYYFSKNKKSIQDKMIKESIEAQQKRNWNQEKNKTGQTSLMQLNANE